MKLISIKMPENLLEKIHRHTKAVHISRKAYIRLAIDRMNPQTQSLR